MVLQIKPIVHSPDLFDVKLMMAMLNRSAFGLDILHCQNTRQALSRMKSERKEKKKANDKFISEMAEGTDDSTINDPLLQVHAMP